jgi:hypothetical protein
LLIYNWTIDRWSMAKVDVELLCRMMSKLGETLDTLDGIYPDLDAMPLSLDSALLSGSPLARLSAFRSDRRMAFFEGASLPAEIESTEVELTPGGRTFVGAVRPLVDGGVLSIQVGTRERTVDPVQWSAEVTQNSIGACVLRAGARYHRARLKIAAGEQWAHAQGIDVEAAPEGMR